MIVIPEGEQRRIFQENFVHGAIFLYEKYKFEDGSSKAKFILVLNPRDIEEECHFYLTTSKVSKLMSNPILRDSCYVIPVGEVKCFRQETAINIRNIRTKKYTSVELKYIKHTYGDSLKYVQEMPENIMSDIKQLIINSPDITSQRKLKIYPTAQ